MKCATVVGGGVGGLLTAAALAKAGAKVTLIDKNNRLGGRLDTLRLTAPSINRTFAFDTGPSLLLLPSVYRDALESVGANASTLLLKQVRPSYAVHFSDGLQPSTLCLGGDALDEARLREGMEAVEPGAYAQLRSYIRAARALLRSGLPIFIRERLGLAELMTLPRFVRAALLGGESLGASGARPLVDWPLRSHAAQLAARFGVARHRALLSYQDLYIGERPSAAPSVFSLLQAIEIDEPSEAGGADAAEAASLDAGVYYPLGGFGTVRDLLVRACEEAGVDIRLSTQATKIETQRSSDGQLRVSGVRVSPAPPSRASLDPAEPEGAEPLERTFAEETLLESDCVLVNADLAQAEPLLLGNLARSDYSEWSERSSLSADGGSGLLAAASSASRLLRRLTGGARRAGATDAWRYSTSSVSFFIGLDKRFDALRHHNVFLAPDELNPWEGLFEARAYSRWGGRGHGAPVPFHFYLHAPTRSDPSLVDCETDDALMVLVPVPPIDERLTDAELESAERELVLRARAGVLSALEHIGCRRVEEHIVLERVRPPSDWRDTYGLRRGSLFGLSHGLDQLALLRPARSHGGVRGVHFVGASTRPGNGVPLVMIGAEKAAAAAIQELGLG